jgi:bifunctional enzyme CysN/CysC
MPWHSGHHVLSQVDDFKKRERPMNLPFRFPVQDIYKFTKSGDDRRIVAGTVNTGTIKVGDRVRFLPSGKTSTIKSIEMFNAPTQTQAEPEEAPGFTLETQIYIQRGELMVREDEPQPEVSTRFRANLFWMGHAPMIPGKNYKLKVGAGRHTVTLAEIIHVLDASELSSSQSKKQVDRHDVAECILEASKPVAFDLVSQIEHTGRFVIVDNYEIAGAGIILESASDEHSVLREHIERREETWSPSDIPASERAAAYRHGAKFILIAGDEEDYKLRLGKALEKKLFYRNFKSYYLGMRSLVSGLDSDVVISGDRSEHIRRLGELARIMTDAGQIFISSAASIDKFDINLLKQLNEPHEILVVNASGEDMNSDLVDVIIEPDSDIEKAVLTIYDVLKQKQIVDYFL